MAVVLDTSLVLATMVDDPRADFAEAVIAAALPLGASAPALLSFEVASALSRRVARGVLTASERERHLRAFARLPIVREAAPDIAVLIRIGELAEQHVLSGYDAAFLELALRRGADLGTLDGDLAEAGRSTGLVVHHTP